MDAVADWIVALEQWLRSTPITVFALWVQRTPASRFVDEHAWAEPILQSAHILALAMLFGSVLMIGLRVLGLAGRSRTVAETARRFMPVVWWALLAMMVTGVGLILGDVVRNLTNPIFWTKMILIGIAAGLAFGFQSSVRRRAGAWDPAHRPRIALRAAAAGVIALWCVIMAAGRLIAYAPT